MKQKDLWGKQNIRDVNLPLYMPWRCITMSNIVLDDVKLGTERSLVISLKLRPLRRREKALGIHCVEGWVGRRASVDVTVFLKKSPIRLGNMNPRRTSCYPNIDYVISTLLRIINIKQVV